MFEAKSYNDLRKTFAAANELFAVCWLGLVYAFVLTPKHKWLSPRTKIARKMPD
jgi:hypothetical protein